MLYHRNVFIRRAALVLTALCVIFALALGGLFLRPNRLYSDPALPRESKAYETAHTIVTNIPPVDTNATFLVSSHSGQIRIQLPNRLTEKQEYQHPFFLVEGSNAVSLGQSQITLRTIAINYSDGNTHVSAGSDPGGAYYSPAGELQDPASIKDVIGPARGNLQFRGRFPRAAFYFQSTNLPAPEVMVLSFEAFDRRTQRALTTGHSSSVHNHAASTIWIGADIELWHQTPVELVLTIALGPTQASIHPIDVNAPPIAFAGGMLKLLHIADTEINSWGNDSLGTTNFVTLLPDRAGPEPKTALAFYGWPTAHGIPVQIQLADRDGSTPQHTGMSSSENILIASVDGRPEQLGSIQMRYFPNVYRLVFHLQELPGLPEENRNLKNLFDIQIPFVRIPSEHAYQSTILKLAALKGDHIPLAYSNIFFPMVRTNTTVRELFREMERLASNPERVLIVDPVKSEIRYEPSLLHSFLNKAKQKIGL
jgi:hypothetical protein